MPINFPDSPSTNDTYTFNGRTWKYNGEGWEAQTTPPLFADGSVSAPSLAFTNDTNTGLYRIAGDRLGVTTAGTKALEVAADGKVLFGNATDTNLYRSAADTLRTDDSLVVGTGVNIFATEAARDAALTAPVEGMTAYITGSTVAAATGNVTGVPTGITTVYNGSVWVCTTPVAAKSNVTATTTSTSYVTTLTSDTTAISVTLVTGTTALVTLSGQIFNSAGGNSNYMSVSVSGATTVAAADAQSAAATVGGINYGDSLHRTQILTGLTAGTNTFTLNYRVNAGTGSHNNRDLVVVGIA